MSKKKSKTGHEALGGNTKLVHMGRNPDAYFGLANLPVGRVSTIMYPSLEAYENPSHKFRYGRVGNPASEAFETAIAELEEGCNAITASSGLGAITTAILAFVKSGDHLLMCDGIYPPTRQFCDDTLRRMGVEVEYYDPLIGKGIEKRIRKNTTLIYMESPCSATFEVQDVPAIAAAAKKHGVMTMIDNSWSGGLLFKPIRHGVNVSVQSATKYIGGHSDLTMGVAVADTEKTYKTLKRGAVNIGAFASPDDLWLALRGLRTMAVRMKQNAQNAMVVAQWLEKQPEIKRVFYPPLKNDPSHKLWKRDFSGANGLLAILLKEAPKKAASDFVNGLELFPIGSSWGGYESLLQPQYLEKYRSAVPWTEKGACLRLQIGLEDPEDLIVDLEKGLERFRKACK
ncbi:MAG: cystathionine beta-lyase [Alphaproteobacteria bacterium]|nr:cystathionine beta-lyase [Alphaproteobacteria bacterium]QQS56051.1 MAG: cystathionine beta-lyase [Alphaproteobacteria bacterium]